MPLTMEQLKSRVERQDLRYFVDPHQPMLLLDVQGANGTYRFLISLQDDGQFLQFRTVGYLTCTADNPHLPEVFKVLGVVNYENRLVKYGWDSSDGEIAAYADVWIMDGTLTDGQFARVLQNFVPIIDSDFVRIKTAADTGRDPRGENDEPAYSTI